MIIIKNINKKENIACFLNVIYWTEFILTRKRWIKYHTLYFYMFIEIT